MSNHAPRDPSHILDRIVTLRHELNLLAGDVSHLAGIGDAASLSTPTRARQAAADALAQRRSAAQFFDSKVFVDPATNILLSLYTLDYGRRGVTTGDCCAAAGVPRTTALRYIGLLQTMGHIVARDDFGDARKTLLHLSDTACNALEAWLAPCSAESG